MSGANQDNPSGTPEESEGSLPASDELEAALREATEAVEARRSDPVEGGVEVDVEVEAEGDAPGAPEGIRGVAADDVPESGQVIAALRAELEEKEQKYVRMAADFDNFRKRTLKDREEAHKYGHQNLVKDLLPSVDNLERAIAHAEKSEEGDVGGLLEGVELVARELVAALEKHGVTPVDPQGEPFDPALHEAMAQAPDASVPPNTVTEVFQRGYVLRTRLLRPARVVVSKARDAESAEGSEERDKT